MLKLSIKYAIFCGTFLTILFHVTYYFGSNPLTDLSQLVFDLTFTGLFIFFAAKEFKVYQNEGYLHFWQGMTIGFLVYTISAVIFVILLGAYFYFDTEAVINYKDAATKFLDERADMYIKELGKEAYTMQLEQIQATTAGELIMSAGFKKLLAGFFVTPVISIILRKQPK